MDYPHGVGVAEDEAGFAYSALTFLFRQVIPLLTQVISLLRIQGIPIEPLL